MQLVDAKTLVVTQANALARAAQTMTLQEKRLLLLVMSRIRQSDTDFTTYQIPVTEIQKLLDLSTKEAYRMLEDITKRLMSRVVKVDTPKGGWEMFQWVSKAKYVAREDPDNALGRTYLELRLHQDMRPLLLQLSKHFASIPLAQLVNLPSFNSVRLFEILYHESHQLQRHKLSFALDDLKLRLGAEGKYPNFADFERRILLKAQEDCQTHTPLHFSYSARKTGRKVSHVDFLITRNGKVPPEQPRLPERAGESTPPAPTSQDRALEAELRASGFLFDPAKTIARYGADLVRDTLKLAKKRQAAAAKGKHPITNLGGLIYRLLKEGTAKALKSQEEGESLEREVKSCLEKLMGAFDEARRSFGRDTWGRLPYTEQTDIHQRMGENLRPFTRKQLQAKGWQGPFYEASRHEFMLRSGHLDYPPQLLSLEAFLGGNVLFKQQPRAVQEVLLARLRTLTD